MTSLPDGSLLKSEKIWEHLQGEKIVLIACARRINVKLKSLAALRGIMIKIGRKGSAKVFNRIPPSNSCFSHTRARAQISIESKWKIRNAIDTCQ